MEVQPTICSWGQGTLQTTNFVRHYGFDTWGLILITNLHRPHRYGRTTRRARGLRLVGNSVVFSPLSPKYPCTGSGRDRVYRYRAADEACTECCHLSAKTSRCRCCDDAICTYIHVVLDDVFFCFVFAVIISSCNYNRHIQELLHCKYFCVQWSERPMALLNFIYWLSKRDICLSDIIDRDYIFKVPNVVIWYFTYYFKMFHF